MLKRRELFHFVGAATLMASGVANAKAAVAKPFRHYPFDPVAAENFQQNLFIPVDSGPFGVLDVAGPLTLRATPGSLDLLPGKPSPFLLYPNRTVWQELPEPHIAHEQWCKPQAHASQ